MEEQGEVAERGGAEGHSDGLEATRFREVRRRSGIVVLGRPCRDGMCFANGLYRIISQP